MVRTAARKDANHADLVATLRRCGLHVVDTAQLGHGVPDILCTGYNHHTGYVMAVWVEIKTERGKLTSDEAAWHADYPADGPLLVARSADDVLRWFGRV